MSTYPFSNPVTSCSPQIPPCISFTERPLHMPTPLTPSRAVDIDHTELLDIGAIWKAVRSGEWYPGKSGDVEKVNNPAAGNVIKIQNTTTSVVKRLDKLQRKSPASSVGDVVLADFAGHRAQTHFHRYSTSELRCILAALQSLSSPWRRLPDELLLEVFSWCIPLGTTFSASEAPLLLTKICSRWHILSVNTPSLWTSLTLTENFLTHKEARLHVVRDFEERWRLGLGSIRSEFISTILRRSHPYPISLSSHAGILLQEDARNLFYGNFSRLKNLALFIPESKSVFNEPIPTANQPLVAPFLETLDIYAPRVHGPPLHRKNWAALYLNLIHSSAPTLRRLTLCASRWPKADFNQNWCNLTYITWGTDIPEEQIITLFHSAPNLSHASLPNILPSYYDPSSGAISGNNLAMMTSLKTLVIGACNMEGVFSAITAPNLLHLVQLSPSNQDKHAMTVFLQRSACLLETLYLYNVKYDSYADLLDILQRVEGGAGSIASNQNQIKKRVGHLKALLVADGQSHGHRLLSDEVLDKLTWRQDAKQTAGEQPVSDMATFKQSESNTAQPEAIYHNRSVEDALFPGLEYLSLYDIRLPSPGKLPEMLRSRTTRIAPLIRHCSDANNDELPQASTSIAKLKVFETWHPTIGFNDVSDVDWAESESLRAHGLVFRLFESSDSGSCMSNEEKVLLRRYVREEGLVVRDFLHDTGLFAPIALDEETRM